MDWTDIDTVLLDMDGTLLDLHFDSHFWREHLPARYAERRGLSVAAAKSKLFPMLEAMEGTIEWYCLDYWSQRLDLDLIRLKEEVQHLIAVHPHVPEFLDRARALGKRLVLVTNAHQGSLALKMQRTGLAERLDDVVCAHEFGLPKERTEFWARLHGTLPFLPGRTLLIDDSLPVLHSARRYGIERLLAPVRPDSRQPARAASGFDTLHSFADILPADRGCTTAVTGAGDGV